MAARKLRWLVSRGAAAPGPADALVAEADALRDSGNPLAAAALYRRAIESGGGLPGIRKQLANMLKDSGRFQEAYEEYGRCLEADRNDSDTFLQLGHLFKLQGETARAIEYYTRAAEGSPPSADAAAELATLRAQVPAGGAAPTQGGHAPQPQAAEVMRIVQELSARVDGLAEQVAFGTGEMSEHERVAMQEARNNWHSFVPLLLNMTSAVTRIGAELDDLVARTAAIERRLGEAGAPAAPSAPPPAVPVETLQGDWQTFAPLLLNMSSTLARLGADLDTLAETTHRELQDLRRGLAVPPREEPVAARLPGGAAGVRHEAVRHSDAGA